MSVAEQGLLAALLLLLVVVLTIVLASAWQIDSERRADRPHLDDSDLFR